MDFLCFAQVNNQNYSLLTKILTQFCTPIITVVVGKFWEKIKYGDEFGLKSGISIGLSKFYSQKTTF